MTTQDFLQDLRRRKEISITVKGRRTGRAMTFPVWFVLQGETLWLLPVRGSRTQWHRNVLVNPTLTVRTGRKRRTFVARSVDHRQTVKAVVESFRKKYSPREITRYYTGLDIAVEVPLNPRYTPVTPA